MRGRRRPSVTRAAAPLSRAARAPGLLRTPPWCSACRSESTSGAGANTEVVVRIDGATLRGSPAEFDRLVRQRRVPVVIEGLTDEWAAHERWATREQLVHRHGDVQISLRDTGAVARSGGAFHSSHALSLREFIERLDSSKSGSHSMLFSTARDECWSRLSADYEVPSALQNAVAQPIVSIGGTGGGLSFHQHEENWLALIAGQKRWLLAPPTGGPPQTAHRRVVEESQPRHEGMLVVDQQPGQILYLPAGWWHCTYNYCAPAADQEGPGGLTIAVGGMGYVAGGAIEYAVRSGDLHALRTVLDSTEPNGGFNPDRLSPMIKAACEAGQVSVLQWLLDSVQERNLGTRMPACDESPVDLLLRQQDAGGATAFHWAAAGGGNGHAEIVQWLLSRAGVDIHARDMHGCTPLHWAARGGHPEVTRLLLANGADMLSADHTGVTPLHLFCGEGHLDIVRTVGRPAGYAAGLEVKDDRGFTPLDWAVGCGRQAVAAWLREQQGVASKG